MKDGKEKTKGKTKAHKLMKLTAHSAQANGAILQWQCFETLK